jgi:hypothetical protein
MGSVTVDDKRRAPRVDVTVPCALRRHSGRVIPAETLNLGPGGMLVSSDRPLSIDEALDIDLADLDVRIVGPARVLRHQGHMQYALRFEGLPAPMAEHLHTLALSVA